MSEQKKEVVKGITELLLEQVKSLHLKNEKQAAEINKRNQLKAGIKANPLEAPFYDKVRLVQEQIKTVSGMINLNERINVKKKAQYLKKIAGFKEVIQDLSLRKNLRIAINDSVLASIDRLYRVFENLKQANDDYVKAMSLFNADQKLSFDLQLILAIEEIAFLRQLPHLESLNDALETIKPFPFQASDYSFISEILELKIVETKEVKEVIKYINVPNTVQKDKLLDAYDCILGYKEGPNLPQAIVVLQQEAEEGRPQAMNALGHIFRSVPPFVNKNKAAEMYYRASNLQNSEGKFRLGQMIKEREFDSRTLYGNSVATRSAELKVIVGLYQLAADMGHAEALSEIGVFHEHGLMHEGVTILPKNLELALNCYEKSLAAGCTDAMNNLACLLIKHDRVKKGSFADPIELLKRADQAGNPRATANLARCYESGLGVEQNLNEAHSCFRRAAAKGDPEGILGLCQLTILKGSSSDQQYIQAAEYLRDCLKLGFKEDKCRYLTATLYQHGLGVTKDPACAFHHMNLAANLKNSDAVNKMGDYYFSGFGCSKNLGLAKSYYQQAVKEGHPQAMVNLALLLEDEGVDDEVIYQLLKGAAAQGNSDAYLNLALLLQKEQTAESQDLVNLMLLQSHRLSNGTAGSLLKTRGVPTMRPGESESSAKRVRQFLRTRTH